MNEFNNINHNELNYSSLLELETNIGGLKPCPFCGNDYGNPILDLSITNDGGCKISVACTLCNMKGPSYVVPLADIMDNEEYRNELTKNAILEWNTLPRRTTNTNLTWEELEEEIKQL